MPHKNNEENLQPVRSEEEAREKGRRGGIASGEARRKKRDIRQAIEMLLERDFEEKNGKTVSGAEAIAMKQFEKALKGDTRAFEVIRDTAGQKPTEQIEINSINPETIAEVEEMIKNAKERHSRDSAIRPD